MRGGVARCADDGRQDRRALALRAAPVAPRGAVVVLHGGREHGTEAPPPWNLPGARMRPFVRSLARAGAGQGVAVGAVRYRCRGWNGACEDPARDARQALDELRAAVGEVPTVLLGHSMGGRAALRVAGRPFVRGVVGLAPWCPETDPVGQLAGKQVFLVHGDRDRTTDPRASAAFVDRAREAGAAALLIPVPGGEHTMLRGAARWHRLATRLVTGMLGLARVPDEAAVPPARRRDA